MSQEYPKMLYSGDGNKVNHSGRVVHSAEEEAQFREIGFVDYADLPEFVAEPEETTGEAPQGFVTVEQFDSVAERLAVAEDEIKRLHEVITIPIQQDSSGSIAPQPSDYSAMSNEQLRAVLDEKGIKYLARDGKETLINLLEESNV